MPPIRIKPMGVDADDFEDLLAGQARRVPWKVRRHLID
jgi:hypothetical protein